MRLLFYHVRSECMSFVHTNTVNTVKYSLFNISFICESYCHSILLALIFRFDVYVCNKEEKVTTIVVRQDTTGKSTLYYSSTTCMHVCSTTCMYVLLYACMYISTISSSCLTLSMLLSWKNNMYNNDLQLLVTMVYFLKIS